MKISNRKQSFGNLAKDYQKYRLSYDPRLYKLLFSLIKNKTNISVLDIGCGTGKSTTPLVTFAPKRLLNKLKIIGIDPDKKMLVEARAYAKKNKLPITYLQGNAEKLGLKKETIDAVIAGTAFHWFATKKAFTNINKVLKPGGVFMVFWTWRQRSANKTKSAVAEVLEKYSWKSIDPKWRDTKEIQKLFYKTDFSRFGTISIPYTEVSNLNELVGLCKTVASYAILSASHKKEFIRDITKAYKAVLGPAKSLKIHRELHICYGFK
jgi:ubiquinone/menaquinone biosynthesis C-methylase UbiE